MSGLYRRVIAAVAVVALVWRLQGADIIGLRAGLLDIRGYDVGGEDNRRQEESYSRSYNGG
jgi:hypothetical protein